MELWLVRDVPTWLVGILLMVGLPAAMLGLDELIHRRMPHRRLDRHNPVTGALVSVVAVAYAVVIGLCVVTLWEGFSESEDTVRDEATNLTALAPTSRVFGQETQRLVTDAVIRYQQDLIDEWPDRATGDPGEHSRATLDNLAGLIGDLRPETEAQRAFVDDAVERVGTAQQLHQYSLAEVTDGQMSSVMWLGVLASTVAVLGMCLFFGLDDGALRRILVALATLVIATNLFLVVQMNYPYHGSFSVTPSAYEEAVADLRLRS